MPDGEWGPPPGTEGPENEVNYNDGQLPGHVGSSSHSDAVGPNSTIRTVVDIFSDLEYEGQGDGTSVSHICNNCGESHTETYTPAVEFPTAASHAPQDKWGSRTGSRHASVKVTGVIRRRTATYLLRLDGSLLGPMEVTWERRNIDHIEQRPYINWTQLTVVDCMHGVQDSSLSILDDGEWAETELVAMLNKAGYVGVPGTFTQLSGSPGTLIYAHAPAFLDGGGLMPELGAAISKLEKPQYKFEYRGDIVIAVVAEETASGSSHEIGRLELEYNHAAHALVTKSWKPK